MASAFGAFMEGFAPTYMRLRQEGIENSQRQQQLDQAKLQMEYESKRADYALKFHEAESQRQATQFDQRQALDEKQFQQQGERDRFTQENQAAGRSLDERQFQQQTARDTFNAKNAGEQRTFDLQRENRIAQGQETADKRILEDKTQGSIDDLIFKRQEALGYGEDTSVFDQRIVERYADLYKIRGQATRGQEPAPQSAESMATTVPSGRGEVQAQAPRSAEEAQQLMEQAGVVGQPNTDLGAQPGGQQAVPGAVARTRGRQATPKTELAQQAGAMHQRAEMAKDEAVLKELGKPTGPEQDNEPTIKSALSANTAWRAHDMGLHMAVSGSTGAVEFQKVHATGRTPLDGQIVAKDPDLLGEATIGMIQMTRDQNAPPPEKVLDAFKEQVIGSGVEAYKRLWPSDKPLTTTDMIQDPNAAAAVKVARHMDTAKVAYEHITGQPLDVQGLPGAANIVEEGPDVLSAGLLNRFMELKPQGVRSASEPGGVQLTEGGRPEQLIQETRGYAQELLSHDELSVDAKQSLNTLANEIASEPGTPAAVIANLTPVFEKFGIGTPTAGGTRQPSEKIPEPAYSNAPPSGKSEDVIGKARGPVGKAESNGGGGFSLGTGAGLGVGAQGVAMAGQLSGMTGGEKESEKKSPEYRAASGAMSDFYHAGGGDTQAKAAATAIDRMGPEERATMLRSYTQMRGIWIANKIDPDQVARIDKALGYDAPKAKETPKGEKPTTEKKGGKAPSAAEMKAQWAAEDEAKKKKNYKPTPFEIAAFANSLPRGY